MHGNGLCSPISQIPRSLSLNSLPLQQLLFRTGALSHPAFQGARKLSQCFRNGWLCLLKASFLFVIKKKKKSLAVWVLVLAPGIFVLCCGVRDLLVAACGIWFPDQGLNLGPLCWEHGVKGTGPPGKSCTVSLALTGGVFYTWLLIK